MSAVYEHSYLDSDAMQLGRYDVCSYQASATASSLVLLHVVDHDKIMLCVRLSIFWIVQVIVFSLYV